MLDVLFIPASLLKIGLEVYTWTEYIYAERLSLIDADYVIVAILFILILADSKFLTCDVTPTFLSLRGFFEVQIDCIPVARAFQEFHP